MSFKRFMAALLALLLALGVPALAEQAAGAADAPGYVESEGEGAAEAAPEYGEAAPEYGEAAPEYGEAAPEYGEVVSEPVDDAQEPAFDGSVDPVAGPALDAGDTGLSVELEDPAPEPVELDEIDLPAWEGDSGDGAEDAEAVSASPEYAVSAEDETELVEEGLNVAYRTQAEIQAFVDAHPAYRYQAELYRVAPKDEPYAVGYLSQVNQRSALNLINQMRYIAGLGAEVSLYSDNEYVVAATSLVLRLYGKLSHYPPRAEAISGSAYDTLYSRGYAGASRSNIAMGYKVTSAIPAYVADADDANREHLGHRRWILNPPMGRTVFGANGRFNAMYAVDKTGAGGQTRVAWPAQETPVDYFSAGDPWSVSFGRTLTSSEIEVDLVRRGDGRTWRFSESQSDGYFNVDNGAYGQVGCVIFQPTGLESVAAGDVFDVSITDWEAGTLTRYTVRLFSLDRTASTPLDRLDVTAVKQDGGVRVSWSADSRAEGYYVCRVTDKNDSEIIADVTDGTAYLDTAVAIASGVNYRYRVFAHTDSLTSISASDVTSGREPDGVTLDVGGTVTLYTNDALQLTGEPVPSYADTGLTWKSSNERVATVDENGLVTPVKKGTATITVTADNGKKAKVKVRVAKPPKPTGVTLDQTGTVKLSLGKKLALSAEVQPEHAEATMSWSSSDRKVAKVTARGVVKPVKPGTAVITVRTGNGKSASVKVKVVDPTAPTKVKLDRTGTVKLAAGEKLRLSATIRPATAAGAKLTWTSADRRVARVSSKGLVTAVGAGTTTVTVATKNGKRATVKIRVTAAKAQK